MRTPLVESNGVPLGIRAKERVGTLVSANQKLGRHFPRAYESKRKQCLVSMYRRIKLCRNYWTLKRARLDGCGEKPFMRIPMMHAPHKKYYKKNIYLFIYLFI
jgi:hypothetical protein